MIAQLTILIAATNGIVAEMTVALVRPWFLRHTRRHCVLNVPRMMIVVSIAVIFITVAII